jgi:hypothetical protein
MTTSCAAPLAKRIGQYTLVRCSKVGGRAGAAHIGKPRLDLGISLLSLSTISAGVLGAPRPKPSPVQTRPWLEGQAAPLSALLRDGICIRQSMYRAELRERSEQAEHDVCNVPRPDHFWGSSPKVIFYFYMMFWFVGASAAAIALLLWFVSELGALLRWWFNRVGCHDGRSRRGQKDRCGEKEKAANIRLSRFDFRNRRTDSSVVAHNRRVISSLVARNRRTGSSLVPSNCFNAPLKIGRF